MATNIGKLSAFDVTNGNWRVYVDRVEMYYKVNKVTDDMKLPILISAIGDAAYELMVTLCSPQKPGDMTYAEVVKIMENHLQPCPSVLAERFRFRQCRQVKGQSIKDYVAELKKLSRYCEFKTTLSENLRDQFACGINNDLFRQRLFTELKLDFEKAVAIASNLEAAERDALAVESSAAAGASAEGVHYACAGAPAPSASASSFGSTSRQPNTGTGQFKNGCSACGDRYHNLTECRFQNFVCSRCGKMGHLRRVCPNPMEQFSGLAGRRRDGASTGRGARSRRPRGRNGPSRRSPNAHWLQDEYQPEMEEDECSEDECINQMSLANYKPHGVPLTETLTIYSLEENFLYYLTDYSNESEWRQVTAEMPAAAGRARFVVHCGCTQLLECENEGTVYADVFFKINGIPKANNVMITPETGTALETLFRISTLAVLDSDAPLYYTFRCRVAVNSTLVLGAYADHLAVETFLPYIEDGVEIWVEVCDVLGACSRGASKVVDLLTGDGGTAGALLKDARAHIRRCELMQLQRVGVAAVITYKNTDQLDVLTQFCTGLVTALPSTQDKHCLKTKPDNYLAFLEQLTEAGCDATHLMNKNE